jgi:hypothetical protein
MLAMIENKGAERPSGTHSVCNTLTESTPTLRVAGGKFGNAGPRTAILNPVDGASQVFFGRFREFTGEVGVGEQSVRPEERPLMEGGANWNSLPSFSLPR